MVWISLGDQTQPPIRGVSLDPCGGGAQFSLDQPGGGVGLDRPGLVWVGLGEGSARIGPVQSGSAWIPSKQRLSKTHLLELTPV